MTISIEALSNNLFQVTVKANNFTIHKVIVKDDFYKKLTKEKISKKQLIEFSFEFLLKRESNNSILPTFELNVISNYFPEYIKIVKKWIGNS